jgi:hypothetical protein
MLASQRCWHCNQRSGFRITIFDNRTRGDNSKPRLERVVAAGEKAEGSETAAGFVNAKGVSQETLFLSTQVWYVRAPTIPHRGRARRS